MDTGSARPAAFLFWGVENTPMYCANRRKASLVFSSSPSALMYVVSADTDGAYCLTWKLSVSLSISNAGVSSETFPKTIPMLNRLLTL